jgi:hypothetical protein
MNKETILDKEVLSESEREIFDKAIEYRDKKLIDSESIHGFIVGAMWMKEVYESKSPIPGPQK